MNIEKKLTSKSPADIVINVREVMPKNRLLFLVFLAILMLIHLAFLSPPPDEQPAEEHSTQMREMSYSVV